MAFISAFPSGTLSECLRRSNYWPKQNRNDYPLKIYRAISELYEWIDCPCGDDCECKNYQCEKHLVRKTDIDFKTHYNHFLECYVDSKAHEAIRQGRVSGRGYRAVQVTAEIENRWTEISITSSKKHLLCSNWCEPLYESLASDFPPKLDTIYRTKWLSLLCFDTFTAYDSNSVALLRRDYQNPANFLELMRRIRQDIIAHLKKIEVTLQDFRRYDKPSEFFGQIPENSPRPLGDIIDKLYLTL